MWCGEDGGLGLMVGAGKGLLGKGLWRGDDDVGCQKWF